MFVLLSYEEVHDKLDVSSICVQYRDFSRCASKVQQLALLRPANPKFIRNL